MVSGGSGKEDVRLGSYVARGRGIYLEGGDRGGEEEEEFSNNCTNDLKRHAQRETD